MKKILLVLSMILLLTGCSKGNSQKENNSNEIDYSEVEKLKSTTIEGIKFSNQSMVTIDGKTTFIAVVKNTTSNEYALNHIDVKLIDKNGKVVDTLYSYIGEKINAGESKKLTTSTDKDISEVINIKYDIIK